MSVGDCQDVRLVVEHFVDDKIRKSGEQDAANLSLCLDTLQPGKPAGLGDDGLQYGLHAIHKIGGQIWVYLQVVPSGVHELELGRRIKEWKIHWPVADCELEIIVRSSSITSSPLTN